MKARPDNGSGRGCQQAEVLIHSAEERTNTPKARQSSRRHPQAQGGMIVIRERCFRRWLWWSRSSA